MTVDRPRDPFLQYVGRQGGIGGGYREARAIALLLLQLSPPCRRPRNEHFIALMDRDEALPLLGAFRKAADQRSSDPKPGNRDERDQNRDRDETLFAAGERIHLAHFPASVATPTDLPFWGWT